MSENRLGGDDMVELAAEVISAIEEGWKVVTWYGPDTEVLVAGIEKDFSGELTTLFLGPSE